MIRAGAHSRDSIRGSREDFIDSAPVHDATVHPMFRPIVDIRARIFDMQHETALQTIVTVDENGERNAVGAALPFTQDDC